MKFTVNRVSSFNDEEKPCDDAVLDVQESGEVGGWVIHLNSLEELMNFTKREGKIVVFKEPRIQIYDDYRE